MTPLGARKSGRKPRGVLWRNNFPAFMRAKADHKQLCLCNPWLWRLNEPCPRHRLDMRLAEGLPRVNRTEAL